MNVDHGSDGGKVEEPLRIGRTQVNAAMTHGGSEIIMPIGAMQCIALVVVHREGYAWEIISRPRHRRRCVLNINSILPSKGRMGCSSC